MFTLESNMAERAETSEVLNKFKFSIAQYLNIEEVTIYLRRHGIFTHNDKIDILFYDDNVSRTQKFVDILSKKSLRAFQDFCACLQTFSPHLLTIIASDHTGNI